MQEQRHDVALGSFEETRREVLCSPSMVLTLLALLLQKYKSTHTDAAGGGGRSWGALRILSLLALLALLVQKYKY